MSNKPKPFFMMGRKDIDDDDDDDEIDFSDLDSISRRIESKIRELGQAEKSADDDEYFMGDDTDNNDLFESVGKESGKTQIEYSKSKLESFPESANILGSLVKQSVAAGDFKQAKKYADRLKTIPIERHGFDTIVIEIKYMFFDPYNNEKYIRKGLEYIKKKYPKREEGLYFEGMLESRLGNVDRSMELLKAAIGTCINAPRSAEYLTYEMLKSGELEETIKYSNMAITMSASLNPNINLARVCYCRCLAQDGLLCRRIFNNGKVSSDEINKIRLVYESLKNEFSSLNSSETINSRISVLNQLKLSGGE